MKLNQVAAQLYTLRAYLQTPAEIAASLKKVREIGYTAVQLSGLGPIGEAELNSILAGEGLTNCATHEPSDEILNETDKVIDHLQKLNCTQTAYPYPGGIDFRSAAEVKRLVAGLNAAGEKMAKAGITLSYHNHHMEFFRLGADFGHRLLLEVIYEDTDPRFLQGEIDTYWVQFGGQDPAAWCRKLKGRLPLLHMKDYAIQATTNATGGVEYKPVFSEIGYGTLNWKSIIGEAEAAGTQWYIVEQDTCPGDPFDSLKLSFDWIKGNLCI